jgi:hypothetical protein
LLEESIGCVRGVLPMMAKILAFKVSFTIQVIPLWIFIHLIVCWNQREIRVDCDINP